MGVQVNKIFVQQMKTRWGSCNYRAGHIRLNSALAQYPPHLLEYVVVHELVHDARAITQRAILCVDGTVLATVEGGSAGIAKGVEMRLYY